MADQDKPILCLDFDGVIHSYTSKWMGVAHIPDPPVIDHNGISAIKKLYEYCEKFKVCIYSTRSESPLGIQAMIEWLAYWESDYWREHPNEPRPRTSLTLLISFPKTKPPALVTVDDRAVTFDGTWPEVEALLNFKPWNRK